MQTSSFQYQCTSCNRTFAPDKVMYLCPDCSAKNTPDQPPFGVLKVLYDYNNLKSLSFSEIEKQAFLPLLPLKSAASLPPLRVGNTPLYNLHSFENKYLPFQLLIKDDSTNPTFSYKDRASALVSAYAKENKMDVIAAASTGNAGASMAGICASQKQKAIIFVPTTAPKAKLTQIMMYGATIVPVDGNYDAAFDLCIEASNDFGWYHRNTSYNPFTVEGKKTAAFEIFSQLNQKVPDRIFVPVGDGVIVSSIFKGFEELILLGFADHMPVIVSVQADGSSNIIRNLESETFVTSSSHTVADSISVDIPRNFRMAKQYIKQYKGETCLVTDEEIVNASALLAKNSGVFTEPAGAAAFAGMLRYKNENKLVNDSVNVILCTGSGLKDVNAVQQVLQMPAPIKPDINLIKNIL
ncbi:MAG: threonine synthase [Bacteroidota bacterium]